MWRRYFRPTPPLPPRAVVSGHGAPRVGVTAGVGVARIRPWRCLLPSAGGATTAAARMPYGGGPTSALAVAVSGHTVAVEGTAARSGDGHQGKSALMNPRYSEFKILQMKPLSWHKLSVTWTLHEAVDLVSRILQCSPNRSCTSLDHHPGVAEELYAACFSSISEGP